jgi:hypothetical protein
MSERVAARDILKITRDQIERLLEISPAVPDSILQKYKDKFKGSEDIAHPEIIKGYKKVFVNKYIPEKPENTRIKVEFKK